VPEGIYNLRIVHADKKERTDGSEYLFIVFQNLDEPTAEDMVHFLDDEKPDDKPFHKKMKIKELRQFASSLGWNGGPMTPQALLGQECVGKVGTRVDKRSGKPQNTVLEFTTD